jgi:type VI secretion system protein ImpB
LRRAHACAAKSDHLTLDEPARDPRDKESRMGRESTQKKLERVRPPRVQIAYEVETGGAIELKEIPFVMAVLADLSGQPAEALPKLMARKFVDVTPDNFDDVLASMKPRLQFAVENKLSDDPNAGKIAVELNFRSMDDFAPDAVVHQVKPLQQLLDLRTKLADLRGALQGNEKLDEILQATVTDEDKMKKLKEELGTGGENG